MKDIEVRLAAPIQTDSIVDGEGLRTVIWFQGCHKACPDCHNPASHSLTGGKKVMLSDILEKIENLKHQDGITCSGGEPMLQPEALLEIAKTAKQNKLNIWCYSGFTFEQIVSMSRLNPIYEEILKNIDVLVDGEFIKEEKSLNLWFKGSRNQRVIDVKKTLKKGEVVLIPKYKKEKKFKK